jgi:outer membrane protein assembly factor BamB
VFAVAGGTNSTLLWTLPDAKGPALLGAHAVVLTVAKTLVAVDAFNGTTLWTYTLAGTGAAATVMGSLVFVGDGSGTLHAVQGSTGAMLWKGDLTGGLYPVSSPGVTADGGTIIVGTSPPTTVASIIALDALTGVVLWSVPLGAYPDKSQVQLPPTIDDASGHVYVAPSDAKLWALAIATGNVAWQATLSSTHTEAGYVALDSHGNVFVNMYIAGLSGFTASGKKLFSGDSTFHSGNTPVTVTAGGVLFTAGWAVNATTGARLWEWGLGHNAISAAAIGDDGVIVVVMDNVL